MRERQSSLFYILPGIVIIILSKQLYNIVLLIFGIIILFLPAFFIHELYLIFFINKNSTCALYAGKIALDKGYDPKGQNGKYWDPGKLKLTEIYELYKEKRSDYPVFGTTGFVFTIYTLTHKCINIEFYEYTENKQSVKYYSFYFDHYNKKHDRINEKIIQVKDITPEMVFVPLEKR